MNRIESAPRVNGLELAKYPDKDVRLVGKVVSVSPNNVILLTADHQQVAVNTFDVQDYRKDDIVEVVGQVQSGGRVLREQKKTSFGPTFDMTNYAEVLRLKGLYSEMF